MNEIETLAKSLMIKHGLSNWKFEWDNAKRRSGACRYNKRTISLSKVLTPLRANDDVRNTILHEIAHALVGGHNGHNDIWRKKFIEIGGDGNTYRTDTIDVSKIKGGWIAICPNGHVHKRFRKPKYRSSCAICNPVFDAKHLLNFVREL